MRLYTVYDRVAEQAGPVYCAVNDGVALRMYRALLQGEHVVDPDVYWLYALGDYDVSSMVIVPISPPARVELPESQLTLLKEAE